MEQQPQSNSPQTQHPLEKIEWRLLTDAEKTKVSLGSLRMLDEENFKREFGSYEYPTPQKMDE